MYDFKFVRPATVRQAANQLRVAPKRLWRRVRHYVEVARARDDMSGVRYVGIDETSVKRGHAYITVVHDLDAKRLRRVFVNLAANATDVIAGKGTITLRFHQADGEVITELADSGPGIAPEMADKLFQPFATYGKAHGTGLGLSICKKTVEAHGGRISAASRGPGTGTTFTVTVPIRPLARIRGNDQREVAPTSSA